MGIKLKRSAVAGKAPATTDVDLGELAVNTWDGRLYLKKDNGTASVVEIGPVRSVAGRAGDVVLVKADVGLGNADNTPDTGKPVSVAMQAALDAKAASLHTHAIADVASLQAALNDKAPLASPGLTGTPTAPTAAAGTATTQLATTAFVADAGTRVSGRNGQTGTAYVLAIADAGDVVEMNNASANTLTVPPNASVAFPLNTRIDLIQYGAGQTTVAAGAGVTIRSSGGRLKLAGQYSGATLYKRGTDEWLLVGDLAA